MPRQDRDRDWAMWITRAHELKVGERDINAELEQMKQDLPATVGQQLAGMRESGFTVTCAYRNLIFAVLSGTKPVNASEPRPASVLETVGRRQRKTLHAVTRGQRASLRVATNAFPPVSPASRPRVGRWFPLLRVSI